MKTGMICMLACRGSQKRDCFALLAMTGYSKIFMTTVIAVIARSLPLAGDEAISSNRRDVHLKF